MACPAVFPGWESRCAPVTPGLDPGAQNVRRAGHREKRACAPRRPASWSFDALYRGGGQLPRLRREHGMHALPRRRTASPRRSGAGRKSGPACRVCFKISGRLGWPTARLGARCLRRGTVRADGLSAADARLVRTGVCGRGGEFVWRQCITPRTYAAFPTVFSASRA